MIKKIQKKAVALFTVSMFLVSLLPAMSVSAGTLTPDTVWYTSNPSATTFTVADEDDLVGLSSLVNSGTSFSGKTVTLVNDCFFTGTNNFTPIGTSEKNLQEHLMVQVM